MTRDYIYDTLCIRLTTRGDEDVLRWWSIRQPPPMVAFALQARLSAALGPASDAAVRLAFRLLDPGAEEDLAATADVSGDALALRAWRRSRAGVALSDGMDGESIAAAGHRLRAVLAFVAANTGVGLDSAALVGVFEREETPTAGKSHRWSRHGLLHVLLHESGCRYMGDGAAPRARSWAVEPEDSPGKRLAAAADGHSLALYSGALDAMLHSPEELAVLSVACVLHLYRPF